MRSTEKPELTLEKQTALRVPLRKQNSLQPGEWHKKREKLFTFFQVAIVFEALQQSLHSSREVRCFDKSWRSTEDPEICLKELKKSSLPPTHFRFATRDANNIPHQIHFPTVQ